MINANEVFLITLIIIGIMIVVKDINIWLILLLSLKIIVYITTELIAKYKLSDPPQPSDIINSDPPINILLPIRFGSEPKQNNRNQVRYFVIKRRTGFTRKKNTLLKGNNKDIKIIFLKNLLPKYLLPINEIEMMPIGSKK